MNIDYENIERDINDGTLRIHLQEELTVGFRQIQQSGERLPVASHYAAQIAEIINRNATLNSTMQFELYQEVLEAVEAARVAVLGEVPGAN
jgi:flagellar biosynthesis/type III secretory pathway protein FliH